MKPPKKNAGPTQTSHSSIRDEPQRHKSNIRFLILTSIQELVNFFLAQLEGLKCRENWILSRGALTTWSSLCLIYEIFVWHPDLGLSLFEVEGENRMGAV